MAKPIKQRVLKPGVVIAGKYRIEKPIARGGFSVIYRAVHVDMDREVGLKILQLGDNIRANWLERFSREARLASQLTHQNTVTIFDYGQDDRGFLYLAMEWIDGESLYQIFEKRGALDPVEVAQIARQILASLDEAHRRGILHRDLKPSNIMLTENYEGKKIVKVLDFGIAKIFEAESASGVRITREGGFVGTPRYASPEQLDGNELTPAADIYPVGLLMWEGLVGDPAVPGIEFGECAQYHASPEPWKLPEATAIPSELTRIVHKALAKNPRERYDSARAMHDELAAWLASDEAREASFGQIAAGGFFSADSGLGEVSSDPVEEPTDDLFADLTAGFSPEGAPLELEGPTEKTSGGPPPFNKNRDEPERPKTSKKKSPPLPRPSRKPPSNPSGASGPQSEPRRGASSVDRTRPEKTASGHPPGEQKRPSPSDQQGAGAVAGVGPSAPARSEQARRPDGADHEADTRLQRFVVWGAVAAIVIAALIAVVQIATGDDASDAPSEKATATAQEQPSADEEAQAEPEAPPTEPAQVDEQTMSVDAILMAMRQSGWRQQGEINRIDLDDGSQHSSLFRAGESSVAVTIFETPNASVARDVVRNTGDDERVVRFGHNVVRMRPASGPGKNRATKKLENLMLTFKDAANQ
jgi:serine/threonine-protein kinase